MLRMSNLSRFKVRELSRLRRTPPYALTSSPGISSRAALIMDPVGAYAAQTPTPVSSRIRKITCPPFKNRGRLSTRAVNTDDRHCYSSEIFLGLARYAFVTDLLLLFLIICI